MPEQYRGFRIWNLEFQAMKYVSGSSDVTIELDDNNSPTGRLLGSNSAIYWSEDDVGLACHLRDFLKPMWDNSNGVGWSLDNDLYDELYEIVSSGDSSYQPFIDRNPNIFHSTLNPTGEKTIKLVPTSYTRAMFFKHSNGYKAMIGLSLYASDADNHLVSYVDQYSRRVDPGFNRKHIFNANSVSSNNYYASIGGLFISLIPTPNSSAEEERFYPEYSIKDDNFFASTMTKVVPMMHTYYVDSSSSHSYFAGCSWLKTGTSTAYNNNAAGVLVGTNMKLSLMLDSKANIGLSYKYTASSNTVKLNPVIFIGPLFNRKLSSSDTLCTKNIGVLCLGIYSKPESSYRNAAWLSYYSNAYYNFFNGADNTCKYIGCFNESASDMINLLIYAAYPALDSSVYTNYRYAKSGYTTNGFIDEDIIRWSSADGLVVGQTYNDGQWCFIGNVYTPYAENGTTSSNLIYPSIRWDGSFNGTKTFA